MSIKNTKGEYVGLNVVILKDHRHKDREDKLGIIRYYEIKGTIAELFVKTSGEHPEATYGSPAGVPAIEIDKEKFIYGDECIWADIEEFKWIIQDECNSKNECSYNCTEEGMKKCREKVVPLFRLVLEKSSVYIKKELKDIIKEIQLLMVG